jgi:hypothetical protein
LVTIPTTWNVADVLVRAEEAAMDVYQLDDAGRLERDEEELGACRSFVQLSDVVSLVMRVSGRRAGAGKE